jgi:GNAT superfamily N-acetyltransferase
MPLRTVDWPHLRPETRRGLPPLFVLDGGAPWDDAYLRRIHRAGTNFTPYHAVFALEGTRPLAQAQVIRFSFRFAGEATSRRRSGVDYLVALPGSLRRGLGTRLLREVHRREREAGSDWIFLWTRRSWGAHRLYEKMGYRDVYSPPAAFREIPRSAPDLPTGFRFRVGAPRDAPLLERLFSRATGDRVGFVPRYPGSFRARFSLEWARAKDHRILLCRGRPVGYARVTTAPRAFVAEEILAVDPTYVPMLLRGLEHMARGRWLVFSRTTFVSDRKSELLARGYDLFPSSHATLMARPLVSAKAGGGWAALRRTIEDPRFSLHSGDAF